MPYLCGAGTPCLLLDDFALSWTVIGPAGLGAGSRAAWACWVYVCASVYESECEVDVQSCLVWSHVPGRVGCVCAHAGMEWRRKQGRRCLAALC